MKLVLGDCLELLPKVDDESVKLILIDPPYNIGKDKGWDKWKTIHDYINWCSLWLKESERILKSNGSLYIFHNDIEQIAQLMEYIRINTKFKFNSFIVWEKPNFRALSWKNPSDNNNLRSWFNICEYCLCYTFQDFDGRNFAAQKAVRPYMREQLNQSGFTKQELNREFYKRGYTGTPSSNRAPDLMSHIFGENEQIGLPTEENYKRLQEITGCFNKEYEELRKEYEELRKEYEELRYTHNLDKEHNNVWVSNDKRNTGKLHPTQKPVDILERIIKCSSNERDLVLDFFMGSGSTGVACVNTNRDFIGIEKEEKYFEIAKSRIEEAKQNKG